MADDQCQYPSASDRTHVSCNSHSSIYLFLFWYSSCQILIVVVDVPLFLIKQFKLPKDLHICLEHS